MESRANAGLRVRALLGDAGLSVTAAAKLFQVTPRTVQNWRTGTTRPPGSAFRLLRIMAGFRLPSPGWEGWHFHSGKLWTPEGHRIDPQDGKWWSLLVRQARGFRAAYAELTRLRMELRRRDASEGDAAGAPSLGSSEREARGLVPSINSGETAGQMVPSGAPFRYHIDHVAISCPTPSDSLQNSMQRPASDASALGSASTHLSPSLLMPTSGPDLAAQPAGRPTGPRPRKVPAIGGVPRSRSQTRTAGVPSTLIPTSGPLLTRSSPTAGRGSIRTIKLLARPSKRSTGQRASAQGTDSSRSFDKGVNDASKS